MSRRMVAWGRLGASALVFAVLVWRLGTGPFLNGFRTIDGGALAAAAGLAVLSTVAYAWRWKIVAGGLGVDLSLPAAVAAYYRSMFLNATLPGGIVGDVHRGVSHGRDVHDVGRAMRSVAWERFAGQLVQVLLTVLVLLVLPSPVHSFMPLVAIAVVVGVLGVVLVARARPDVTRSTWARLLSGASSDIRNGLLARRAWLGIALASALGVVRPHGHLPHRRADGRRQRAAIADAADRVARHGGDDAAKRRQLGSPGGGDGMGVRRGRPRRATRGRHRRRLRRHGPRGQPPRRRSTRHRLVPSQPISAAGPTAASRASSSGGPSGPTTGADPIGASGGPSARLITPPPC